MSPNMKGIRCREHQPIWDMTIHMAATCRRCRRAKFVSTSPTVAILDTRHWSRFGKGVFCRCRGIAPLPCVVASCSNEARYYAPQYDGEWSPLLCGIHDIEHNEGRGKLERTLREEKLL